MPNLFDIPPAPTTETITVEPHESKRQAKQPARLLRPSIFSKCKKLEKSQFVIDLALSIELIKKNQSDAAMKSLKVILSNGVLIRPFSELTKEHFMKIRECLIDKKDLCHVPKDFPPSKQVINIIESQLQGVHFYKNFIYISSQLTPYKMAKTIIHEIHHHINYSLYSRDKKAKSEKVAFYLDEIRSHTAEKIFKKNGGSLLRSDVKKIHAKVAERYNEFADIAEEASKNGYIQSLSHI